MRVKVSSTGLYTYPDASVACSRPRFEDKELDVLLNPTVIAAILSKSTEAHDRGEKFAQYRTLDTLTDRPLLKPPGPYRDPFCVSPGWLRTCRPRPAENR